MAREYGSKGRVGVAPPQANPTVEPEIAACLPPGVSLYVSRLTSACPSPTDRILDYYNTLDRTMQAYDTLKLDAFAFACTASSYLVGHDREDRDIAVLSARFKVPMITGGQAICAALKQIGARKIAMGAPYPAEVIDAAKAYYEQAGFTITSIKRIDIRSADTRAIYELGSADAIAAVKAMDLAGADTILFTGSGMPSFRAIIEAERLTGRPALASNLAMGWWLCRTIGQENWARGPHKLLNGWQSRIDAL
jgi:maleate isomerase